MKLDGWNWEDAAQKVDDGIHLNWPRYFVQTGWWAEPGDIEKTKKYDSECQELEDYFTRAKSYFDSNNRLNDIQMRAMKELFNGKKRLYIHANGQREITDAVLMAEKMDIENIVIVGAQQAHKMTAFLKEHNVSLLLDRIHRLPYTEDSDVDMPLQTSQNIIRSRHYFWILLPRGYGSYGAT
jgi:hypothetical protein